MDYVIYLTSTSCRRLLYSRQFPTLVSAFSLRFQMVRMSTGHMEGDLQPLYLLLTDCYIYLLRKGESLVCNKGWTSPKLKLGINNNGICSHNIYLKYIFNICGNSGVQVSQFQVLLSLLSKDTYFPEHSKSSFTVHKRCQREKMNT